ncbi:MAG: DUF4330 domain-containing protein [Candidatus Sericytochromatia bacterium]|nr:DUF4330 domain-containing protein [Candidatus Sericytochromatia bacterium]
MPLLDARGKLFGLVNALDALIVSAVMVGVVGVVAVKGGHSAVTRMAVRQGPAEIDLMIRANIKDLSMFKVGDRAFITIRNQPYDKVEIVSVKAKRQEIAIPIDNGRALRVTPDPTTPFASEVLLTLRDNGMETADGIVWGGQKLKLGVPIEVEGFKYRFKGSVIDVRMVAPQQAAAPVETR